MVKSFDQCFREPKKMTSNVLSVHNSKTFSLLSVVQETTESKQLKTKWVASN